jgi:hypothetical protein
MCLGKHGSLGGRAAKSCLPGVRRRSEPQSTVGGGQIEWLKYDGVAGKA